MDDYPCVDEATCINNEGDFECACPEGYHGNGKYYCGSKCSFFSNQPRTQTFNHLVPPNKQTTGQNAKVRTSLEGVGAGTSGN